MRRKISRERCAASLGREIEGPATASGNQFGLMTMDFVEQNAKAKFGKEPKDLRVAIIHEDGSYGVDVSKGNEAGAKKAGFNVVLKEGYSATAPDLSALVTKLKRARPDVIFHTGYNPDITLFFRQAREQGLKFGAIVGHGAGELIAEGVLAVEMGATAKDLSLCVHPHPTLSETVMESAEVFYGHATHVLARKK